VKKIIIISLLVVAAAGAAIFFFLNKPKPLELISRNVPAYANDTCGGKNRASKANNANYEDMWRSCKKPLKKRPAWLAYDLSKVKPGKREELLIVWYNEWTSPYDHTLITAIENPGYNNPGAYAIEVNAAAGGKLPKKGWKKALEVKGNTFHSRQHLIEFEGYNWVRMTVTKSDGTKDNFGIAVNMDIYGAKGNTDDNFIFYGDSITQMAMGHHAMKCAAGYGIFSELIKSRAGVFPVQENGGTGYMKSSDGAKHIKKWLAMFPGKYVGLSYGTNDAWSCMDPKEFHDNYEIMVKAVLDAGKIPIVPVSIPWSSKIKEIQICGVQLNESLARVINRHPEIIKGPDYRKLYKDYPSLLSEDGVHPSWPEGLFAYRKAMADVVVKKIYKCSNVQ